MNRLDILKAAELARCPCCDSDVELQDCTEDEYGWRGFRILCRECHLIMYSESTDCTLTADGMLEGTPPEEALEKLLKRWGAKIPYIPEEAAK